MPGMESSKVSEAESLDTLARRGTASGRYEHKGDRL